ncbi:MAG: Hsp20/alpha crystallin family protein [Phycisphaerales bacterium]|nr:Hsp20/alpha crystallin family protein [Phycisphaerales bacterium]
MSNTSNASLACKRVDSGTGVEPVRRTRTYVPAVDIVERSDEMLIVADVPGVSADGVEVSYERGELRLHARVADREPTGCEWLLREFGVGDFVRSFRVGEGIDSSRIDAEIKDGVLTVRLPKAEAAKRRKITVKAN